MPSEDGRTYTVIPLSATNDDDPYLVGNAD